VTRIGRRRPTDGPGAATCNLVATRSRRIVRPSQRAIATLPVTATASYTPLGMDLRIADIAASPAEREAVDALLDPRIGSAGGWDGGERNISLDGRFARGGHAARARRDMLLPTLHAVQDRVGWISPGAVAHIARRLTIAPAEIFGVASFYALLSTAERPRAAVHVCDDMACRLAGAERVCDALERELGPAGEPGAGEERTWHRSPCLGLCERAPAAMVTIAGEQPVREPAGDVDAPAILARLDAGLRGDGLDASPGAGQRSTDQLKAVRSWIPQAGEPGLRLLARVGRIDPTSLTDYLANGGYRALRAAIDAGPRVVIEDVVTAEVLGRGGAAFPTGRKWVSTAAATGWPKYVVCNADEAEPGTFKDRAILEQDPFSLIEAMTIAGFAIDAERGYLYIRGEYPLAEARIANAIALARGAGLLGERIMGSDLTFDIEVRRGGGAYIAGEETALFESIEGDRPEPRSKPPFPVDVGLFGRPTIVNNVETMANIPHIVLEGGAAYAELGTGGSRGTKLFSISGHVARPGVYEVSFGTRLGELIDLAGGVPGGRPIKAVLVGGAAGRFVGPQALSMPLTYEDTRAAGATLGSGAVVVFDETTDLLDILRRIAAFFRDESCGQCVPCRVGTVRQEELLARLIAGRPRGTVADELALFEDLRAAMRDASICGLGQMASDAVDSGLRLSELVP
jgi:NADH-quinone oxidoreductase subunit F